MELKSLKNEIKGKDMDIRSKHDEVLDLQERNTAHLRDLKETNEKLDVANAKVTSLEEVKVALKNRVSRYGEVILSLRSSNYNTSTTNNAKKKSNLNNLSSKLKETNNQLKEYERINKNLAEQIANFQTSSAPEHFQKLKEV